MKSVFIIAGVVVALGAVDNLLYEAIGVLMVSIAMAPEIYLNIKQSRNKKCLNY